ncbi:MAG TPA: hypothetical protein VGG39_23895 [Polyangiaceae bacterium]|jgi:hypothetical protein
MKESRARGDTQGQPPSSNGERGDARAGVLTSDLEQAVDSVLAIELEYSRVVRRLIARGRRSWSSLAEVDAAREKASKLLVAWSHNPMVEHLAIVAHAALLDLMEKTIADANELERREEAPPSKEPPSSPPGG